MFTHDSEPLRFPKGGIVPIPRPRTRWEEYLICKERGHQPGGMCRGDGAIECKHCRTYYWTSVTEHESCAPKPPESDG